MATTETDERPQQDEATPAEDKSPLPQCVTGPLRYVYFAIAGFFFVLALLGAVLPGLPTTPFLLLTSYFLVRSSPACNRALLRSRFFGPILRDWQQHRGVRRFVKAQAIGMVVTVVALSWYLSEPSPVMLGVIVGAASVGILIVILLPSVREERDSD